MLDGPAVDRFVADALAGADLAGRSVCVVVPDSTRSCPLPLFISAIHQAIGDVVSRLTVLVALGTHPAMSEHALAAHVGAPPGVAVRNHEWWDPAALVEVGTIGADTVARVSGGRLAEPVVVRVNRLVVDHDVTLVVGPVFPHEVVGFSGGNKYFFPGVSGPELIDLSHWLGALITSTGIIGVPGVTPVRALIDAAAAMLPTRQLCLAMVVDSGLGGVEYLAFGTPAAAWERAAQRSARTHIRYLDRPVRRVLSVVSTRYDEIWTAGKGMYKVDPVVADGGEVVLLAPHVREVSATYGAEIKRIGYHCRDYFLADLPRYDGIPRAVLAHSTHVRGTGTMDPTTGEHCRITVTLATGIDEPTARALALDYLDPASIDVADWSNDPGTLVVPDAGEILYRLR